MIISPIKAVVGTTQLVSGVALAIIPGVLAGIFYLLRIDSDLKCFSFFAESLGVAGIGATALTYSLANMIALGLLAFRIGGDLKK